MGQKVHPLGFRLGVSQKHISHWFIDNNHYSQLVVEDQFIRNFFYKKFPGIASINIKRDLNRIIIEILSANTRDLLLDGGKMTAKATLSSSSQVSTNSLSVDDRQVTGQGSVHSNQAKLSQNGELDSSNSSQTQELEQQKIGVGHVEKISSFKKSGGSSGASVNNLCDQLLKELTIYRDTRLKKTLKFKWNHNKARFSASDRSQLDNFSATDKTASSSLKNPELISDSGQIKNSSAPTGFNPPTEFGKVKKTVSEKAPLLHEIELFWTKVENPNTSAACLAEFIVEQLEKRVPFRRVLKRSIQKAEEASVQGVKVQISGRLNGAEIARSERIHKGQVPLHTLRAKIEYNSRTAKTIYGLLGVKVWVFNGFAELNQTKLLT